MRPWPWLWILLCSPVLASAQMPCVAINWDGYPSGIPYLGFFRVYVSQTSGQYRFCGSDPACVPVAIQVAIPDLVTEMPCAQIVVWAPGTYYLVMTAVSLDMSVESPPSNEVSFVIDGAPLTSIPPTTLPPPIGEMPPLPLPPPWPTVSPTQAPPPASRGGGISSTCMWQGTCR